MFLRHKCVRGSPAAFLRKCFASSISENVEENVGGRGKGGGAEAQGAGFEITRN